MTQPVQSSAPTGWYSDPESPDQERLWDGQAWTDNRRPRPQGGSEATERVKRPPFVLARVAFWLAVGGLILSSLTRQLGLDIAVLLAALVVGIVALTRKNRPRAMAIWAICLAAFGIVAGISLATGATATSSYDQHDFEHSLLKEVNAKGGALKKVECPSAPSFSSGSRFQCVGTDGGGTTSFIDVRVQDNDGSFVWQTR
jgi:hypothetical protein